jgi:DNA-binding transcriptional regulator YiaG
MSNLTSILRAEITRLARRQISAEIAPMKKRWVQQRKTIAALKDECAALRRELASLTRRAGTAPVPAAAEGTQGKRRFRIDGFRSFRTKLGVSARQLAALLQVSEQTIYNWESAATRPQPAMIAAIAELRALGKRELQARLLKLQSPDSDAGATPAKAAGRPAKKAASKSR